MAKLNSSIGNLVISIFIELTWCPGVRSCWNKRGHPESENETDALKGPFIANYSPSTTPKTHPLTVIPFTKHYLTQCSQQNGVPVATTKARLFYWIFIHKGMIQRRHVHCSRVNWSSLDLMFFISLSDEKPWMTYKPFPRSSLHYMNVCSYSI